MVVPVGLQERCARWDDLKKWERRDLGRELRKLGMSYREIAETVPAAKGTIAGWCRDIALGDAALARLELLQERGRQRAALSRAGHRRHLARQTEIAIIRATAADQVPDLINDPLWVAGTIAYWAEGAKTPGPVGFANSDPAMIRLFIRWSNFHLGRGLDDMTCRLHLHAGQAEADHVTYWSSVTGIPAEAFGKTFIKPPGTGHRHKILYRGVATVRLRRSTDTFHTIAGWIEGLVREQALSQQ